MKHARFWIVVVAWLLVLTGFGWTVRYSVVDVRRCLDAERHMKTLMPDYDKMSKAEVLELYARHLQFARDLHRAELHSRRQALWAAILMLAGASLLQLARAKPLARETSAPLDPAPP